MNNPVQNDKLIRPLDSGNQGFSLPKFSLILFLVIMFGFAVGYFISQTKKPTSLTENKETSTNVDKTAGIADKKTFKDKAEGILKEGGIDGEGNFHLERPGGKSQNAYLTSSTVDLAQYVGKKIRVWGQTFTAEKAGWLMDVGLVEVLQ